MNDPMPQPIGSNPSTPDQARFWLGIGLPVAILAAGYIPFLLLRSELPARVASHFDSAGRADDSMTIGEFLVVTGVMVVIGLGLCIAVTWRRRPVPAGLGAIVGFLGPFIATLGGGILATTAVSQRGIDSWMDAPNAWWSLLIALIGAIAAGTAGARLDTASTIDVRPKEWGGWGYRGSLKLLHQAAVVHRAGPGIRLDLKDGKIFVVTVDGPETGVALLNAQVQRGRTAE